MKWFIPFLTTLTLTPLVIVMPLVSCSGTEMKESGSLDSQISSLPDTVEIKDIFPAKWNSFGLQLYAVMDLIEKLGIDLNKAKANLNFDESSPFDTSYNVVELTITVRAMPNKGKAKKEVKYIFTIDLVHNYN
ncbi:hypothetical protein [Spiroplasma endosymbiont of Asaphidion curtum]|uniref:hypothetical protein n=1 Tax=Spiroplasma endosymbiont of Asaphidion curtum TaxID=3066281 RepID=UPI00313C4BAE